MGLDKRFSDDDLVDIIDQASVYTCACPSQVCKAIFQQRALYQYQQSCLGKTYADQRVHQVIAHTVKKAHAELEQCLEEILEIEGWDRQNLVMPADLEKELVREVDHHMTTGEWSRKEVKGESGD